MHLDPVEHHHRQAQVGQPPVISFHSALRVRSTNARDTADFDVERAPARPPRRPAPARRRYLRVDTPASIRSSTTPAERVATGEMLVRLKRHLALPIRRADPRALDLHPPAAQRDLAILMPVADRGPLPVPLALRADDLLNLRLQQLVQHPQPDLDRQREQPLPRCPDQLPQRLLHALREHGLIVIASATGTFHFTAVPPSILAGSPATLPPGADGPEGPPSPQSSTSPGTTSCFDPGASTMAASARDARLWRCDAKSHAVVNYTIGGSTRM